MKTIDILVAPGGQVKLETHGFSGEECREASRFLTSALGKQLDERLTSEFHQQRQSESQNTSQR